MPRLRDLISERQLSTYHEPFFGGGAAFFGLPEFGDAYLSDLNAELVETYVAIRSDPHQVAELLSHHVNTEEHYYATRACEPTCTFERAARFLYLNHASFNGIYRVNLKGKYNVPFGRRKSYCPPAHEDLVAIAARLEDAVLEAADFELALQRVTVKDIVFIDPPYTVAHNNNGFVKYNQKLFSFEDQRRLRRCIDSIVETGAYFIMTNANHESIRDLFSGCGRFEVTSRRNSVGGRSAARGSVSELLVTNLAESTE